MSLNCLQCLFVIVVVIYFWLVGCCCSCLGLFCFLGFCLFLCCCLLGVGGFAYFWVCSIRIAYVAAAGFLSHYQNGP